jgi:exodeoxyribonuclease V gamma subunit
MLGMNHNDYPRQSKAYGFDLMARFPRSGDRSRRNDERYLFLESIVSARDILYISYVGQSIRDNAPIPPSVLVSELLDYIRNAYGTKDSEIVIEHRLQPFSPAYFEKDADNRLFSYSRDNCEAARWVSESPPSPPRFITQGLSPPETGSELYTATPGDLARFFTHPARFLLQKRLRIFLEEEKTVLEENENFHINDPTLQFSFRQRLLESLLAEETPDFIYLREKAAGNLPPETVGEYFFRKKAHEASKFIEKMKPLISKTPEFADIDIDLVNIRIAGRIYPLYNGRLVRYRYWNINPKEWIRTWITHLVLNHSCENKTPKESYLIGLEKEEYVQYQILPPENPENILQDLVKLYKEGMQKPLPFFPDTSWGYAFWLLTKKKEESESFEKAIKFWEGNPYKPGEAEDPYNRLCFNDRQFKKIRFQEIAARFFGPLFDHKNE